MAAYTAEIRIGVTGQRDLERLRSSITQVNNAVDSLNRTRLNVGGLTQSLSNFQDQLARAARGLADVQLGSEGVTGALRNYVNALGAANTAQRDRNRLIEEEIRSRQGLQSLQDRDLEYWRRRNAVQSGRFRQQQLEEETAAAQRLAAELDDANHAWQMFEHLGKIQHTQELESAAAAFEKFKNETVAGNNALERRIELSNQLGRIQQSVNKTQERLSVDNSAAMMRQANMARMYREQNPVGNTPLLPYGDPTLAAIRGGARRVGSQREIAGGARTQDEAAATLRWAQATQQLIAPLNQVDAILRGIAQETARISSTPLLPSSEMLNAGGRRIQRLQPTLLGPGTAAGEAGFRGAQRSRAEQTAAASAGAKRAESLALGVGFPLMFGAGPATLAGSLAGSFMGSGFGGQILAGGIGQKFDEAAKAAADFSRSMRDGGDAAGYLTEKLGYVNPETKRLIQNLQESGQTAKAAALAQRELGNAIGPSATKDLKAFGDIWDYVGRKFQTFTLSVTANLPKLAAQLGATMAGGSVAGAAAGAFASAGLQKLGVAVAPKETPETKAATEKTKELRDQLTIAKANYTVTLQNATLNEKAYITAKAQTLQAQKTADYEKIIKDTKNGKLSPAQKLLEVQKLEVDYASKARDLDKERVQLLDQRNQVALVQAQAGMQVGILQQQVQLAREQNTASDVRKASLQGQIGIQQALNNLETINLQIAQERAKTQKDINQNKIKELEAQRNVANTQVDLAQAQAAQQTQQAQISTLAAVYGIAKDRINVEKDILNVNQQLVEIYGTTGQILQSQVNTSTAIYKANKASLDIEQKIEMMQNPSMVDLIADKYKKRLELLEKQFDVQQAIDAQTTRRAEAAQSKILTGGTIDFAITAGSIQDKINAANLDMSMRGKSDIAKASAELALTQESETRQRNLQFTKEMLQLEEEIYSSSGQAQQNLQLEYETRLAVNTEVEKLYKNLYAVQEQQLKLNNFATEYGSLIQDIGGSIQSGLVGAIDAAITGAQSLQDVLSGVLKDIGKMLISFGVRALLGGIQINGVPLVGKAVGGPVAGGTPYMVGEKGPELFVPGSSGTIIPADTTAAMTRYQRQTASTGGAAGGAAGDVGASPASWAMNFETTQFLGQDWVSKDQLMAAMAATEKRATAAGAKAGAQQVATKMRTSPAFRRQVGV